MLRPCRECGQQVSTEAEVCPHCGVRSPTGKPADDPVQRLESQRAPRKKGGLLSGIIVLALAIFVVSIFAGSNDDSQSDGPCTSDWTKCVDNADLANHYSKWSDIQFDCKQAADDRARYGSPKWPWLAFGSFYKGKSYVTSGTAIAIEPDAQFQNGFGAMVHARVECTYDLSKNKVLGVQISPR